MNMIRSLAARFLADFLCAPALFALVTFIAPNSAGAMGADTPELPAPTVQTPPTTQPRQPTGSGQHEKSDAKKKAANGKSSSAEDFLAGYRAAWALIYDQHDYESGIAALRALGYDDNADVATLIGYANRKLGRYDDAKLWYERALAADPNHAVTWSYYGMWQVEQGNVLKAKEDLEKVRAICGNADCQPFRMLQDAIDSAVVY